MVQIQVRIKTAGTLILKGQTVVLITTGKQSETRIHTVILPVVEEPVQQHLQCKAGLVHHMGTKALIPFQHGEALKAVQAFHQDHPLVAGLLIIAEDLPIQVVNQEVPIHLQVLLRRHRLQDPLQDPHQAHHPVLHQTGEDKSII